MYVYISFSDVALIQGRPTFFSRGPNLLFQKFCGPKFSLTLSSSQTKVFRWISWWSREKKGLHWDLIVFFLPKTRWRPKKKGLHSGFDRFFLPKSKWTHTQKKGHSDGFCGMFLQLTARKYQSTNRCRNLWRGPLVGRPCLNWWVPIKCISKISFFACCDYSAYIVSIKLFGEHLFRMKGV